MVNELRNIIIFDYATNRRQIDEEFYRRIAEVVKKHYEIEKYVKDIEFEPIDLENTSSAYNTIKSTITIDLESMNSYLDEISSLLPNEFSETERDLFRYLEAARVIIHELTHAVQNRDTDAERIEDIPGERRKIMTGVDPIFNGNLLYSVQMNGDNYAYTGIQKWKEYRDKRFGYNILNERDAEIQSYSLIYAILKELDNICPHIQKYMKVNVYKSTIMGYSLTENGLVKSPLYKYASELIKKEMIDPSYVSWYNEDAEETLRNVCKAIPKLLDRLKFGMPISRDEYIKIKVTHHRSIQEGYIISQYCPREEQDDYSL